MNNIEPRNFDINEEIVAKTIYWNEKREFSPKWLEISSKLKQEFNTFLEKYIDFVWLRKTAYFRIDAYFDEDNLYILDINASYVDGWWNAMNLTRAVWKEIDSILLNKFPDKTYLQEEIYRPEFELFINEMSIYWKQIEEVTQINERYKTYIYGVEKRLWNLFPYDWLRIDNKLNLAMFSKLWKWENIKVPEFILSNQCSWEDLPRDYVLKVTWKQDISRLNEKNTMWIDWKVKIWKPKKWKLASSLWEENKLVAQKKISPYLDENRKNNQAIIMTLDTDIIAWYVQKSTFDIINDNSLQSPLIFN